jgi:nitrogen regulatory protein P-II 1
MKLIRAYVRIFMVDDVVHALEEAGAPGITAIAIREMGREVDKHDFRVSSEYGTTYTPMVELEIVCRDEEVHKLVEIIQKKAQTGRKGDGLIFISPVEEALRIRTGERGRSVFES